MYNIILLIFISWIITSGLFFYIDWSWYENDNKTIKTVFQYSNKLEYMPIINTFLLVLLIMSFVFIIMVGILVTVKDYINDKTHFIENRKINGKKSNF